MNLSPTSLTFGSQAVGTSSSAQVVTLTNAGSVIFSVSNVSVSGDFSESNDCPAQMSPGSSCTISVIFTPTATGNRTGTLTTVDSTPGSPHTVGLSGTGTTTSLGLTVAQGASSTATVAAGNSASYALSIGGGGISGTASISCSGAPQGATCNVPASVTVNENTPANLNVSVSTTSRTMGALRSNPPNWIWAILIMTICILPTSTAQGSGKRYKCYRCIVSLAIALLLSSCGGSGTQNNPNGTPAGTYTLTITASMGLNSQKLPLTLHVQ